MTSPFETLADPDGIILRREILASGGDDRAIARALRGGDIVRVRNGAYAIRTLWEAHDERAKYLARVRVTYNASRAGVAISHLSAALLLNAPMWRPALDDTHLTRLDGKAGRREAGVCQHRGRLREGDPDSLSREYGPSP